MLVLVCVVVSGLIIFVFVFVFLIGLSLATMGRIHLDPGSIPSRDFSFKVYMK
jgi:hypothetical protein